MFEQIFSFPKLICPLDATELTKNNNTLKCPNNHCFDIAKQGYINLLPVQFKHSLHPGDNKDMVLARTAFLNTGHYQFIGDQLFKIIQDYLETNTTLIDAGCGEGYYTSYLYNQLIKAYPQHSFSVLGFDISKEAVKQATKRTKNISWAVASNQKIPLQDNSSTILTSLFGFPVLSEFVRVLKKNGLLIIANVGPNHLIEMRKQIYQTIHSKKETTYFYPNLKLSEHLSVEKQIIIPDDETILNLLKMTPHFYRIPIEKRLTIAQKLPRKHTLNIVFQCFHVVKD